MHPSRAQKLIIGALGALLILFELLVIGCEGSGGIQGTNTGEEREYVVVLENEETSTPLTNVNVVVEANNRSFLTNEKGEATILIPLLVTEIEVVLLFQNDQIRLDTRVDLADTLAPLESARLVFAVNVEENKAELNEVVDPILDDSKKEAKGNKRYNPSTITKFSL